MIPEQTTLLLLANLAVMVSQSTQHDVMMMYAGPFNSMDLGLYTGGYKDGADPDEFLHYPYEEKTPEENSIALHGMQARLESLLQESAPLTVQ